MMNLLVENYRKSTPHTGKHFKRKELSVNDVLLKFQVGVQNLLFFITCHKNMNSLKDVQF